MHMRWNKKTIISLVLCLGVLFMAVGYSVLSSNLSITGGASITTTWDVRITGITSTTTGYGYNGLTPTYTNDTAKFQAVLTYPGDGMTYKIKVENKGTITAILNTLDITESGTSQVIYEVSGIKQGDTIAAGQSIEITVVARYNSNSIEAPDNAVKSLSVGLTWVQYANQSIGAGTYTINYNANGGSGSMSGTTCTVGSNCTLRTNAFTRAGYKFKGWNRETTGAHVYTDGQSVKNLTSSGKTVTLYAIWEKDNFVSAILSNNIAYADNVSSPYVTSSTGINFSNISSDTNGKGLYYTSTNTENNKPTYYFRGAVENNYVQFGKDSSGNDLYWKIIRINEDGSIRIIYNGTSTTATGANVTIGNSKLNTNYDDNAYVGYMYGTTGSSTYALTHANTNNSTIKRAIDNWYSNNTNLSSLRETHLADAGFCNDRSTSSGTGVGTTTTYYGTYNRLNTNKKPQFVCPNASNDLFTTSTSTKGNKALTVPIGLITADEVWYAGATTSTNKTHYLYTGSYYWTMSPRRFSGSSAIEWSVYSNGFLDYIGVNRSNFGVRPVANLQSGVEITGGDGTSGNPYVIK